MLSRISLACVVFITSSSIIFLGAVLYKSIQRRRRSSIKKVGRSKLYLVSQDWSGNRNFLDDLENSKWSSREYKGEIE